MTLCLTGENTGYYHYDNSNCRNSIDLPESICLFVKGSNGNHDYKAYIFESNENYQGRFPVWGTYFGILRVIKAVSSIFEYLSSEKINEEKDYWNEVKNLFRGLIELVPVMGGLALLFYDITKIAIQFKGLENQIGNHEDIAGIAFEGEILCTVKLTQFNKLTKTDGNVELRQQRTPEVFLEVA
ncbi:MAG: hypothetical protein H0T62_12810 [Parachlamydiaceae bacterium]|nr:hypothetical protein [Parachlamydiaceae bacterium]